MLKPKCTSLGVKHNHRTMENVQPAARREMMRISTGAKLPGILLRSSFLIMMIDDCDDYDDDDDEVDD